MDAHARLRETSLFAELDDREMDALAAIVSFRQVDAGSVLFFEGDTARGFFVLLSGQVRIYKASPEGREFTLHRISPGQMFAEAAIFKGTTFPASCIALEDSEVAFLPKAEFIGLVTRYPHIALKMMGRLAAWLREFTGKLDMLSLKEVPARLATVLLRQADLAGAVRFELPTSRTELARELGTIIETLSRSFKKLRELGLIEVNGKEVEIRDRERLQAVADGEKI
jgi:CRP/FNR family transcriptional regulator